jgi:myo-inositol-1(or 4)-monophosphatase
MQLQNVGVDDTPYSTRWADELAAACECAERAGRVIRQDLGRRDILAYKGPHDVLLATDLRAQEHLVGPLAKRFPEYGIVSEEGMQDNWCQSRHLWAIDPLDGSNNVGYGVAHCAVAVTLFQDDSAVLAVVHDPVAYRWFVAAEDMPLDCTQPAALDLRRATISLVCGYSASARRRGRQLDAALDGRCKRTCSLWAPALDLALVATGRLDAMVCVDASFLDVCAGMLLVRAAGGVVLNARGMPLEARRSLHERPVTFVAAHRQALAQQLLEEVRPILAGK